MKEKIEYFLDLLPDLTKDESDLIETVIKWDDQTKLAFKIAKASFEHHENN